MKIVHAAIDAGINFLDNAWEYHEGESERRMGRAIRDRRDRVFLMTKVCTHGRDAKVAMRQLDESLRRLRTDYLDLWQIHECVYHNDPERHFARGGVVEALEQAKAQGKVRYIGFTGHKDPQIHLRMLRLGLPVRRVPVAAERLRCRIPQFPDSGAAGTGAAGDCRHRDEEPGRGWPSHPQESLQCEGCPALCHEPPGLHHRVGDRLDEGASAEPG